MFVLTACEKIGNCPFASLISALLVFFGVSVYCGTLYRALEEIFGFNVPWYVCAVLVILSA